MPDPRPLEDIIADVRRLTAREPTRLARALIQDKAVDYFPALLSHISAQKAEIERLAGELKASGIWFDALLEADDDCLAERDRLRAELAARPSAAASLPSEESVARILTGYIASECCHRTGGDGTGENCDCRRAARDILGATPAEPSP